MALFSFHYKHIKYNITYTYTSDACIRNLFDHHTLAAIPPECSGMDQ